MALSTVRRILRARNVLIVGSAPLSDEAKHLVEDSSYTLVCVNGSISSTTRSPDLWLLNSRNYSARIYQNPDVWPPERQKLHELMMAQATGKQARHILFLLKNDDSSETAQRLRDANVKWKADTTIHPGIRTDLVRKAGVHRFATAFNISAGLIGTALALAYNASAVTLCGFSFTDGYAYQPLVPAASRKHIPQDQEALLDLTRKHGSRLRVIY